MKILIQVKIYTRLLATYVMLVLNGVFMYIIGIEFHVLGNMTYKDVYIDIF